MDLVTSADGTPIAFETAGRGRVIVFVSGAFNDHTVFDPLAAALRDDFTVVRYDRRARGASGDTPPYRVEREVEDLAAVIGKAGGQAAVFGFSSGAVLALRAAAAGPAARSMTHLFLYEAPFRFGSPPPPADLPARLEALVRAGRPGDAVALFQLEGIGLPPAVVDQARSSPYWPALEAIAQSTVYDATLTTELALPTPEMAAVTTPALVLCGAQTWPLLKQWSAALLPAARHLEVAGGEGHGIAVEATAAAVRAFC